METCEFKKVLVIGAGASGLAAAGKLIQLGMPKEDILILDALQRIGGRVWDKSTHSLGAHWIHNFFDDSNPLSNLARDLNLNFILTSGDDDPGDDVYVCGLNSKLESISKDTYNLARRRYDWLKSFLRDSINKNSLEIPIASTVLVAFQYGYDKSIPTFGPISSSESRILGWFSERLEISWGVELSGFSLASWAGSLDDGEGGEALVQGGILPLLSLLRGNAEVRGGRHVFAVEQLCQDREDGRDVAFSHISADCDFEHPPPPSTSSAPTSTSVLSSSPQISTSSDTVPYVRVVCRRNSHQPTEIGKGIDTDMEIDTESQDKKNPHILTDNANGEIEEYLCEYCIVTASVGVLNSDMIQFIPPLPSWKKKALDSISMGVMDIVMAKFNSNPLPNMSNINATCLPNPMLREEHSIFGPNSDPIPTNLAESVKLTLLDSVCVSPSSLLPSSSSSLSTSTDQSPMSPASQPRSFFPYIALTHISPQFLNRESSPSSSSFSRQVSSTLLNLSAIHSHLNNKNTVDEDAINSSSPISPPSPCDTSHPHPHRLMIQVSGEEAKRLEALPPEQLMSVMRDYFQSALGIPIELPSNPSTSSPSSDDVILNKFAFDQSAPFVLEEVDMSRWAMDPYFRGSWSLDIGGMDAHAHAHDIDGVNCDVDCQGARSYPHTSRHPRDHDTHDTVPMSENGNAIKVKRHMPNDDSTFDNNESTITDELSIAPIFDQRDKKLEITSSSKLSGNIDNNTDGSTMDIYHLLSLPVGTNKKNLLFAGEGTHSDFPCVLHGAILSGWREAERIWMDLNKSRSST